MMSRLFKLILALVAALAFVTCSVAYAYDSSAAAAQPVMVEPATAEALPSWSAFGGAIGGINHPGDLFHVDASDNPADISMVVSLTNAHELIHSYRYLLLRVCIYRQGASIELDSDSPWEEVLIPETYVSLRSAQATFILPGAAKYKVTIDDGCFYCFPGGSEAESVLPKFHLMVE